MTQPLRPTRKLIINQPGHCVRSVLLDIRFVTVGRDSDNHIVIDDQAVSGRHLVFERTGDSYLLRDAGSLNHVIVNETIVAERLLVINDIIKIGDLSGRPVALEYKEVAPVASRVSDRYNFKGDTTTIGRDPSADLYLEAPSVSWRHARINFDGIAHTIVDLGSMNGIYVNGNRVRRQSLIRGDVIQIAQYQMVYEQNALVPSDITGNIRLDAINVRYAVGERNTKRLLLNDVSLSIFPKEFVALVGPSGAGKSTLMNALSGLSPAAGCVMINGADYYRQFDVYRPILGYVPQADIIHTGLPVLSALRYAAELRLPPDISNVGLSKRVEEVLENVGLDASLFGQLVNKLSGGQRKRVSIAVELLSKPSLFFLDEPTSGLDPGFERRMMELLERLAHKAGQTVILVTHATANIKLCDQVAFMAGGRLVYFGPPGDAPAFFGKEDFPEIYTELERIEDPRDIGKVPRYWEQRFKESSYYQNNVTRRLARTIDAPAPVRRASQTVSKRKSQSKIRQWWILTKRNLELVRHDTGTLVWLILVMPLIGVLLNSTTGARDIVGLSASEVATKTTYNPFFAGENIAFVLALASVLLGFFGGAYAIVREQAIYLRERLVNLGIVPYVLSKVGILAGFGLLQAAAFLVVINLHNEFPVGGTLLYAFLEFYITIVMAILASIMLGLFVSAISRSENMVIYIVMFLLFFQIIFAGNIFSLPDAVKPLSWLTISHWTIDALGSSMNLPGLAASAKVVGQAQPFTDFKIDYVYSWEHLVSRWAILGSFAVLFGGLTAISQKRKDRL
jgi:ABC transport system ATP-binding/permease protein